MTVGTDARLGRIGTGAKYLVVPMDHGLTLGAIDGLVDIERTIDAVTRGGAGRTYNFTRTRNWDPNVLVSSDQGSSWSYGGRLLQRGGGSDRPYLCYASDDEAIHFTTTEEHPRAFDNSIYHGYVQDGVLYDSTGTVLNDDVLDGTASAP